MIIINNTNIQFLIFFWLCNFQLINSSKLIMIHTLYKIWEIIKCLKIKFESYFNNEWNDFIKCTYYGFKLETAILKISNNIFFFYNFFITRTFCSELRYSLNVWYWNIFMHIKRMVTYSIENSEFQTPNSDLWLIKNILLMCIKYFEIISLWTSET